MKKACFLLLALITLMSTPSCAQRNASSDYKYLKAIEAYRDEDDAPTGAVAEYAGKHYTYAAAICIREVQVGDVKLKNIEASVVKNQKAPLLLGQPVLERFGTITIDNMR